MISTTLNKLLVGLTAGISLFLVAGAAGQDIPVTITNSAEASYTVSSSDLLETAFGSVTASALDNQGSSVADADYLQGLTPSGEESLRDGVWFDNPGNSRGSAVVENNEFAEYLLDLTASPSGYTINGVDLYSNWGSGGGRDRILVNISCSLIGTPDVFDQILVGPGDDPLFDFNPVGQTQAKMSLSGFSIPGVAAIRFDWPAGQENNAVGYSELDVFGTSTAGDIDPPTLSSASPADESLDVATVSNLVFTFNEDIQAGTGLIELRTVTPDAVVESFDVASSAQLLFEGRNLTIDPTSPLASGVEYQVVIPIGAVDDVSSNSFLGIAAVPDLDAYTFTTDNTPPSLTGDEPLLHLLPTSDLVLQLNEPAGLGTGSFTIHLASDDSIVETISLPAGASVEGDTVVIDIADLDFDTAYYVNLTAGAVTDLSGNPLPAVADSTTIAFTTVADLLIHCWDFETNPAVDSVGIHDGELAGGASLAEGLFGQAVTFAAGNAHVAVNRSSLPETDFTFTCWVNRQAGGDTDFVAGTRAGDQLGAYLSFQGGTPVLTLLTEGTAVTLSSTQNVAADSWTHLAYTVDSVNGATIFVNGSAAGNEPTATGHSVFDNFHFGRRADVIGTNPFEGLIDDARVYAEVLTPSKIASLATIPSEEIILEVTTNGDNLDFTWSSLSGIQYDLVSSTDLLTDPSTWSLYNDGTTTYEDIISAGTTTTLSNVGRVGPTRFFAVIAEEIPPILSADFESGTLPAGWVVADNGSGTTWEVGVPNPTTGPTAAANGVNCIGTNLGDYVDDADTTLTSPAFVTPSGGATLSFEQFLDTDEETGGSDVGSIRLLDADNADAEIVAGPFPITPLEGFGQGWTMESYELPAEALGKNIKVQFQFVSNSDGTNFGGIYLDDIAVTP